MSILDHLKNVPPRHNALTGALNPKYQVTRRYLEDIEKAKAEGYSWGQIKSAVVTEAKAEGFWDGEKVCWDLGEVFRKIKKGA
jgi:hypothetical protein